MSSFVPLNSSDDPSAFEQDLEEHSRELQVEEAFKIYQLALRHQKEGKYREAYLGYEELFKLEVVSNHYYEEEEYIKHIQSGQGGSSGDKLNFLSPNVKLLRYLVFRNRGFLYLEALKLKMSMKSFFHPSKSGFGAQQEGTELEYMKQAFYTMMDDMIIALIYQEGDEKLIETMYEMFVYLKTAKLARYTLEYLMSGGSESDDLYGLISPDVKTRQKYQILLKGIHQMQLTEKEMVQTDADVKRIDQKYIQLEPIRSDFLSLERKTAKLKEVEVEVDLYESDCTWTRVIEAVNKKVKNIEDKERFQEVQKLKIKDLDLYILGDTAFERFKFKMPQRKQESNNDDENRHDSFNFCILENGSHKSGDTRDDIDNNEEEMLVDGIEAKTISNSSNAAVDQRASTDSPQEIPAVDLSIASDVSSEKQISGSKNSPDKRISQSRSWQYPIQRTSRRVKNRNEVLLADYGNIEITRECFKETEQFFGVLNDYLEQFNQKVGTDLKLSNIVEIYIHNDDLDETTSTNDYRNVFLDCLNHWDPKQYTQSLFSYEEFVLEGGGGSSDDEKVKLMEVLNAFGNKKKSSNKSEIVPKISDFEFNESIRQFLSGLNGDCLHYHEIKISILSRLLSVHEYRENSRLKSEVCLLSDSVWDPELIEKVKEWVLQYEGCILNSFNVKLQDHSNIQIDRSDVSFAVSIYELLVDTYITTKDQINELSSSGSKKSCQKPNKVAVNLLLIDLVKINDKISRWKLFLDSSIKLTTADKSEAESSKLLLRYKWAEIHLEKSRHLIWQKKEYLTLQLQNLLEELPQTETKDVLVLSPNFENFDGISVERIKRELTTATVLSILAKVLYTKTGVSNQDAINLLERILIEDFVNSHMYSDQVLLSKNSTFDSNAIESVKKFLNESSVDMKISLWDILILHYEANYKASNFRLGFESYLKFIWSFLTSSEFERQEGSKHEIIIKFLGSYGRQLKLYLKHLSDNAWKIEVDETEPPTTTLESFGIILRFFELFYLFSIHEEAALLSTSKNSVKDSSVKAYNKLKGLFIKTLVLLLVYYKEHLLKCHTKLDSTENSIKTMVGSLLRDFHEQLGLRRLCDSSNGLFLKMSQEVLSSFQNGGFDVEIIQVVFCRYHYVITFDDFKLVEHNTEKSAELDAKSTHEVANFVLPLCFKKNPLVSPPKADLKLLIDAFYESIGDPEFEACDEVSHNDSSLSWFLEWTTLTPRFLKNCFYGLENLDLTKPTKNADIVSNGLYYLQGLLIFTSYKIRKKTTQSRIVELENVIKLLKNDLIYCTNRVESWFLLGQAFGFLVEDDLIWTSDKLTVPERKASTANLQRKSLLCYLMAINEATKMKNTSPEPTFKPIVSMLMGSLAKDLYGAVMQPMDMLAIKVYNHPRFIRDQFGNITIPTTTPREVSSTFYIKVIQQSLHLAIKAKPRNWSHYYYLSKTQHKLRLSPVLILETLSKAGVLAKDAPYTSDPILEPHYLMCSLAYKFVKADLLKIEAALSFLAADPVIKYKHSTELPVTDKCSFYSFILTSLRKIIAYDKKKWHHKPKYRLARILYDDFEKVEEAKEEMSSIVSLRATNKTLVLIWKPENERPGKHFQYTFQYALFYVNILTKQKDLYNLVQMLPKLRRSNSTMISLSVVWETLCSSICKIVRELFEFGENYTEIFMIPISFQGFTTNSKLFMESLKKDGIPKHLEIHMCLLHVISDMKKLNNGFGPTSLIDDTMIALFILIYLKSMKPEEISPSPNEITESPSGKVKKLAKRDFFPLVSDILKNHRRSIENILKERPNIYNDFTQSLENRSTLLGGPSTTSHLLEATPTQNTNSQLQVPQTQSASNENEEKTLSVKGQDEMAISGDAEDLKRPLEANTESEPDQNSYNFKKIKTESDTMDSVPVSEASKQQIDADIASSQVPSQASQTLSQEEED